MKNAYISIFKTCLHTAKIRNEMVDISDLPDSRVMMETTLLCGLSSPSVEACRWKPYLVTGVRSLAM